MEKFIVEKKQVRVKAYKTDKIIYIDTLEGTMKAEPGDWIITGVHGEQYPIKPEIFEKTYIIIEKDTK
ncbi:hypothetical protein FKV88_09390 [Weissella paramesenteroides]|nr:hypothetical protein [Weissella paramesenteroides]KAA8455416.1 hypothetical protein FKV82_09340 [Weissella paramesenteroides]KAA8456232.1 hypothetical protein FKV86_05165 [Weissella paramesenteroides]KAA8457850.1 hypothetical protein FKV78_04925 [Weissella paramesenteroides]KAA8461858.1 hypothetical protein FKV85_06920 [Weissella paramesenteroides]KAA8462543.1 hypothetical protein FKV80_04805 [Weissella paramesenteroides]